MLRILTRVCAVALLVLLPFADAGSPSFTPLLPPSYPLAVRSPYLSSKKFPNDRLEGGQVTDYPM